MNKVFVVVVMVAMRLYLYHYHYYSQFPTHIDIYKTKQKVSKTVRAYGCACVCMCACLRARERAGTPGGEVRQSREDIYLEQVCYGISITNVITIAIKLIGRQTTTTATPMLCQIDAITYLYTTWVIKSQSLLSLLPF